MHSNLWESRCKEIDLMAPVYKMIGSDYGCSMLIALHACHSHSRLIARWHFYLCKWLKSSKLLHPTLNANVIVSTITIIWFPVNENWKLASAVRGDVEMKGKIHLNIAYGQVWTKKKKNHFRSFYNRNSIDICSNKNCSYLHYIIVLECMSFLSRYEMAWLCVRIEIKAWHSGIGTYCQYTC